MQALHPSGVVLHDDDYEDDLDDSSVPTSPAGSYTAGGAGITPRSKADAKLHCKWGVTWMVVASCVKERLRLLLIYISQQHQHIVCQHIVVISLL